MIRGIHHVAVSTPNLERLVAFYRDVMGAEVVYQGGWDKGSDIIDEIVGLKGSACKQAMLKLGNAHLEFFQYESPEPKPGDPERPACDHGYTHFCIDVTDIDAEYERLKAAGVKFNCPPPDFEGGPIRATYGRDPDGNLIEIQQILDPNHDFYLGAWNPT
jgi:catechol 2,3-dioxygenase-like lactoylglutathione lyase family enzyme